MTRARTREMNLEKRIHFILLSTVIIARFGMGLALGVGEKHHNTEHHGAITFALLKLTVLTPLFSVSLTVLSNYR